MLIRDTVLICCSQLVNLVQLLSVTRDEQWFLPNLLLSKGRLVALWWIKTTMKILVWTFYIVSKKALQKVNDENFSWIIYRLVTRCVFVGGNGSALLKMLFWKVAIDWSHSRTFYFWGEYQYMYLLCTYWSGPDEGYQS